MAIADFLTRTIERRVESELRLMAEALHIPTDTTVAVRVRESISASLRVIEGLVGSREILPGLRPGSSRDGHAAILRRRPRVGFYPLAANPIHWGHVCIGLEAVAALRLDTMVYVVAGDDRRKPNLIPHVFRAGMAGVALEVCAPLCELSGIAAGTDYVGEDNLFRFLRLHADREMDVFYVAGGDHYRRVHPVTREADTIQRIEENIARKVFGFNGGMHRISAVFVERESCGEQVDTFLDVHFLPGMPFAASSTMIRDAFSGRGDRRDLLLMPFSAYLYAAGFRLYDPAVSPRAAHGRTVRPGSGGKAQESPEV